MIFRVVELAAVAGDDPPRTAIARLRGFHRVLTIVALRTHRQMLLAIAEGLAILRSQLSRGEFFGEMSLLSGRPRAERVIAGPGCVVVETAGR